MSEERNKDQKPEALKQISRRDFTKGSMAVIGAYSSFSSEQVSELPEAAKELKLEISDDVKTLLDERHIVEDDLRRVIHHGESTGLKLYQQEPEAFLSKLRISETLFYVEYSPVKDGFKVYTAYTHRFSLYWE